MDKVLNLLLFHAGNGPFFPGLLSKYQRTQTTCYTRNYIVLATTQKME